MLGQVSKKYNWAAMIGVACGGGANVPGITPERHN